jgi:hypothetical protein
MQHYKVLVQGQEWHRDTPPCSREASQVLENNEAFVSWLAPRDALRAFSQHIPAILYQGKYWTISLRMSKSIYRSVRLRKGFYNVQTVHGVQTLRIPQLLFNEKQRTQARFKVGHARVPLIRDAHRNAHLRAENKRARLLNYIYRCVIQEMNAKSHSAPVPRKRKSNKANPPCSKKRSARLPARARAGLREDESCHTHGRSLHMLRARACARTSPATHTGAVCGMLRARVH